MWKRILTFSRVTQKFHMNFKRTIGQNNISSPKKALSELTTTLAHSPLILLTTTLALNPLVLLNLLAALSPLVLLGLLADPGPLAAQDGGSLLHGSALLRLVEGGDAVGHRLDDGAATLLQRHRSSTLPRLVHRFGFLGDDDDALVVGRSGNANSFWADDPAAGEAVESRQVQGLLGEDLALRQSTLHHKGRSVADDHPMQIGRHVDFVFLFICYKK